MSRFKDKLIYESQAISLSEISSILLGYSWEELQEAERWRTPEDPEENRKMVERKKASLVPDLRPFIPPIRQRPVSATRELRAVGTAFWELQQWIWIKFPDYSLGSFHDKTHVRCETSPSICGRKRGVIPPEIPANRVCCFYALTWFSPSPSTDVVRRKSVLL